MLIVPGNVGQLTAVLEGLASDPAERRRLGQAGPVRVIDHYAIDQSTAQLHTLFTERIAP